MVSKAKAKALGAVAAFNLWHIGQLGEYTELIIGMGFCTSIPRPFTSILRGIIGGNLGRGRRSPKVAMR